MRAELRRIAGLGNLEHVPGRGRGIKSRYGLIARLGTGALGSAPSQSAGIPLVEQNHGVAADEPGALAVIADIRAAVGDKTGKIMLGELAAHIGKIYELGEAHREECMRWERAMMTAIGADSIGDVVEAIRQLEANNRIRGENCDTLRQQILERDSAREIMDAQIIAASETLAPCVLGDVDTSDMGLQEIAEAVAVAMADTAAKLGRAISDNEALRMQLSEAYAERDEIRLRNDSPPADQPVGYLVRATKRKPRTLHDEDKAREAALGAIRAGAPRAEVFALVPVGQAKRGAEWKEAKG
ncbi:hypothetical protein [Thauera humireducens]|uniref:hypothetical protein n=1 Tax=Thauera humireducens TaxID=1134435 RepID=UPI0012E8C58D|nr:hypothetical protein [Thauera humireducens]